MLNTVLGTLLGSSLVYAGYKSICSLCVFPGQFFAKTLPLNNLESDFTDANVQFSEEKVGLFKTIKTVVIEPHIRTGNVILIFNGQNATFRSQNKINTYHKLAVDTQSKIIGFDYAGTGTKRIVAWDQNSLVQDGFYLAKKAWETMPKNGILILKGNSLGGAIAIKVAKLCHDNNIKAYVWSGRSFRSTSAVAAEHLRIWLYHRFGNRSITQFIANKAETLISAALKFGQFEIDVSEDYKMIPDPYKNYYLVRSHKSERTHKWDDTIIPYGSSLESDSEIKNKIKQSLDKRKRYTPTSIDFYRNNRKMTLTQSQQNAHGLPETRLFARDSISLSAYALFCKFATEYVTAHHSSMTENHDRTASSSLRHVKK